MATKIIFSKYFYILFALIFAPMAIFAQNSKGEGLDFWVKAERLKGEKKYDLALVEYGKAITKEPDNYNYVYSKANCELLKGDTTAGISSLEKVTALKNDYFKAYEDLAKIYNKKKNYDKAIENYENSIKYDPDNNRRFAYKIDIIKILNKAKKYEEVSQYVTRAKQITPNNLDLLKLEARNNNILKRYDSVIYYMQQSLKLVQGRPAGEAAPLYYEMGHAYYEMGQYDKARPMLDKANFGPYRAKVMKMMPNYHTDLATAYEGVYEYEEAEKYLGQALKIDPKYEPAINLQKKISGAKIDKSQEIKKLEDSIKVEKNPKKKADDYCRLCNFQFDALQYDGAMLSGEECLKMNPRNMKVIFVQAVATYKAGQTDNALSKLQKFSKSPALSGEFLARCYLIMGMMYSRTNQPELAKQYFRDPKITGAYRQVAILEMKKMAKKGKGDEGDDEEDVDDILDGMK
jgi:tetratricopeptide (TPR) repeat protein